MRTFDDWMTRGLAAAMLCFGVLSMSSSAQAAPFGQGVFGANVPFGSATSLVISLGSNVSLNLTPSGNTFVANGSHTITVTSNDPVGYSLYIYGPSGTNMTSGANTIPASANGTPATLANNTWGYNTTGSTTNYQGVTASPVLLKTANGPYTTGDSTTVSYGVLTDITKASGSYSVSVAYTAVAVNE